MNFSFQQVTTAQVPARPQCSDLPRWSRIRSEEIQALPTTAQVSGLVPAVNGATIFLLLLREKAAKDAYFNEATLRRHIPTKLRAMSAAIGGIIQAANRNPQYSIGSCISVDGQVDLTCCKWDSARNGKNGTYRMRVQEVWLGGCTHKTPTTVQSYMNTWW